MKNQAEHVYHEKLHNSTKLLYMVEYNIQVHTVSRYMALAFLIEWMVI